MNTSCFKNYRGDKGVAICLYPPNNWKGPHYVLLAPTKKMFYDIKHGLIDEKEYEKQYREKILSKLNPSTIYNTFKDNVLLCWEKSGEFCHRLIVAKWLEESLGVKILEWEQEIEENQIITNSLF